MEDWLGIDDGVAVINELKINEAAAAKLDFIGKLAAQQRRDANSSSASNGDAEAHSGERVSNAKQWHLKRLRPEDGDASRTDGEVYIHLKRRLTGRVRIHGSIMRREGAVDMPFPNSVAAGPVSHGRAPTHVHGRGAGKGRDLSYTGEPKFDDMHAAWQASRRRKGRECKAVTRSLRAKAEEALEVKLG